MREITGNFSLGDSINYLKNMFDQISVLRTDIGRKDDFFAGAIDRFKIFYVIGRNTGVNQDSWHLAAWSSESLATTTHSQLNEEQQRAGGITPELCG